MSSENAETTTMAVIMAHVRLEIAKAKNAGEVVSEALIADRVMTQMALRSKGLTVAEGAARLGCSVRTIERMIASGALPTTKQRPGNRFSEEDLLRAAEAYGQQPVLSSAVAKGPETKRFATASTRLAKGK